MSGGILFCAYTMIDLKKQTILVIAPHPDDEIFGCGGLIHRCKQEGGKVFVLYMTVGTTNDFSKNGESTLKERIEEIEKVAKFLKFDGYRIVFPGNEYHLQLDAIPQKKIIDEIERGKDISLEALKPTMVLTCPSHDYNQDHRAACQATITAVRPNPPVYKSLQRLILFYENPSHSWTNQDAFPPMNFSVALTKENLDVKLKALTLYKSQMKNASGPFSAHAVKTLAHIRGTQTGVKMAESFLVKRFLV